MTRGQLPFDHAIARDDDRLTSHVAAVRASGGITEKRAAVLKAVRDLGPEGGTDEQIAANYTGPRQSPSGLRSRRAELMRFDPPFVADAGRKARISTGGLATVWVATNPT